jgi:hypothetical protein
MNEEITLDANCDSPLAVANALREYGCALLRNALPREPVLLAGEAVHANARKLNELVGQEVNDMPLCFSDQRCTDPTVVGFGGHSLENFSDPLTFSGFTPSWFHEGERNYKRWFWEHGADFPNLVLGLIIRSQLPAVYQMLYGEQVVCSYEHCAVRYQRSDLRQKSYSFHQDASYHSRDPSDHFGLTTWIPLIDCGVDAPGLQLYPRALEEVLPAPDGIDLPYLFCDSQTVIDKYGDSLWGPVLSAGDVLIFNHFVVHRTYVTDGMTKERQSVDFRILPQSRIPNHVLSSGNWLFELPATKVNDV